MLNFKTDPDRKEDFSFLDQKAFQEKYSLDPHGESIRFYVGGLRCIQCVRKLEALPLSLPGLKSLQVEMGKNLAYAQLDPSILSLSHLAENISNLGFQPIPLSAALTEEDLQRQEDRADLIRLAIAGTCAGHIMTFSWALYWGKTGSFDFLFSWLNFIFYLPVVTYVALPFYKGAWHSLRRRQISIDLSMSVASLVGFIFSTIELGRGKADFYFDSLSGFLFLILVSRWAQKRLQRKFLRFQDLAERFKLERVRLLQNENTWSWQRQENLKVGDEILLHNQETLPANGQLKSQHANFNMAWLSGEVKPKIFLQEALIPAGARLESPSAKIQVTQLLNETYFGQILQDVQQTSLSPNYFPSPSDRWAQRLLVTVFICALTFAGIYWSISPEEAIRRALSLMILVCPCAMAFGTPLALASALKQAQKRGLIIRNAHVFEKIRKLQTIFFDKTGTLTETHLSLVENPSCLSFYDQQIILSLENNSVHPIAFALRQAFFTPMTVLRVENFKEVPGVGVSGFLHGQFYELRKEIQKKESPKDSSPSYSPHETHLVSCLFLENHRVKHRFTFMTQLQPGSLEVLQNLRNRGYKIKLLSGDKKEAVQQIADKLCFSPEDVHAEMGPQQKALFVSQTPNSMMVGDGINDSLALMKASVSVATSGGVEAAFRSSDVYLTDPSLKGILSLIEISQKSWSLIRQNLTISLIYNFSGGILALAGYINPLVAALLMPLSSGLLLLHTALRHKK